MAPVSYVTSQGQEDDVRTASVHSSSHEVQLRKTDPEERKKKKKRKKEKKIQETAGVGEGVEKEEHSSTGFLAVAFNNFISLKH